MSTFGELLRATPLRASTRTVEKNDVLPFRHEAEIEETAWPVESVRDEQIYRLAQQLFFGQETGVVRNVGFSAIEASAQAAPMCLDLAKALASEGKYDVGLIDASSDVIPLHQQLRIPASAHSDLTWMVSSRLWFVSRQSWWREPGLQSMSEQDVERLRDFMRGFDFSVVYCSAVSWLTPRIAQSCDGLVLILTANKTRRLVAAQIKEELAKARIPLLGTVLAERRLPVPEGLYRRL
ncbi:MAG: hypothetical protein WBV46_11680 [Terriglobales bacterium]